MKAKQSPSIDARRRLCARAIVALARVSKARLLMVIAVLYLTAIGCVSNNIEIDIRWMIFAHYRRQARACWSETSVTNVGNNFFE